MVSFDFRMLSNYAQEYVNGGFANHVVIMTLLPRNDAYYMSFLKIRLMK